MRLTLRLAAIAASLILFLPLHYLWRLFGRASPWPRRFLGWSARAAGMRVRVVGSPLDTHVLFLANHLSWLDILALAGASGAAFVSKEEVSRWRFVGWLAALNHTVYVSRSDRQAVRGQVDALRAALAAGRPVALFPEGTTDGGTTILPFRGSLLASLFPPLPKLLVQPVAIDYGGAGPDIAWIANERATDNVRRVLSRPGTTEVTIHFLAPIDPADAGDRKALAARSRSEILAALEGSATLADQL